MAHEIPNRFDFATQAGLVYQAWERDGCFHAEVDHAKKPFAIVIPPPNVTGALHLGHALNNTLQDIQVRWHRMMGDATLWMPGTDHAGIATQARVEQRLRETENLTRHDLGRQKLIERIWQLRLAKDPFHAGPYLRSSGPDDIFRSLQEVLDLSRKEAGQLGYFSSNRC
jgi:valyl-tRNA synthetase